MALKFIALSGTTSVNENLYIYEYKDEMVIVDCGIGFPDIEMHGVDLVIPDFDYIRQNKDKLKAIFVSQGHEDHQGALPFLLRDVKAPVYAPKLVAAFIEDKLSEYKVKDYEINVYDPDSDVLTVGSFKFTPFRVSHSIPDTVGFAIDTPEGRVFHVAEHKFDEAPVDGFPFDREKAKSLASEKVLFLASDCLGSNKPGRTKGESDIEANMKDIAVKANGAIFFTAISSNIGRIQQAINVAEELNRKVVFIGRSIDKKSQIAHELGYLKYKNHSVISLKEAAKYSAKQLLYIIAGSYGQAGSSLFRVATGEHDRVTIESTDMVIFSSDPAPPYSKESMDFVVDSLLDLGADVHYYDLREDLYVSGHGSQEDIVELFDIVRPKYFIPIGGTVRFMKSYRKLAEGFGASPDSIFELKPGDILEFQNGQARRAGKIKVKEVLVDGLGIGDVGKTVLADRKTLKEDGVAIVIIKVDVTKNTIVSDPEIISRGFVFEREEKKFLQETGVILKKVLQKGNKLDRRTISFKATDFLASHFLRDTGRRPMILPVVIEV